MPDQQYIKQLEREWEDSQKYINRAEWLEIFPEAEQYLQEDKKDALIALQGLEIALKHRLSRINELKGSWPRWFWKEAAIATDGAVLDGYDARLKKINGYLNPWPAKEGGITDEDIKRAKEYPFTELIEANRAGFAKCPFHNETKASFYIRKNFGYCFSCLWGGDTIKFLMEIEGLNFVQAVRRLSA